MLVGGESYNKHQPIFMIMIHFWFVISFLLPILKCFILKLVMIFYNYAFLAKVWWGPVPGCSGRLVRGGADLEVRTGNGFLLDNRTLHPGKCPSKPLFTIPYLSKPYNITSQVVWAGTTSVGCATAQGSQWTYVVCNYAQPGNMQVSTP